MNDALQQEGNENGHSVLTQALNEEDTEQAWKHCHWLGFSPTKRVSIRQYLGQCAIRLAFMDLDHMDS